ncbi:MAG: alpha/beta hydrolase [Chloroflexi bacterium]|nr:alpha/beta hydrolase [Chloroflexota bacterium]
MTDWQSIFVYANGLRHHIARSARSESGKPPIVLAHGFSDDGLCWASTANRLAENYDVVLDDARGHGQSDAPEQGYGPEVQADDLAGVIAALRLHRPIVLGHSMGAQTALVLAGRYPDVPCAIALEDPPPWWSPDFEAPYSPVWLTQVRAWLMGLRQQPREAILAAQRAAAPDWPEVDLEPWVDSKLAFNMNFFDGLKAPTFDWPTLLRAIRCSALLITGDPKLSALVTPPYAAALKTLLPQVQIAHVAGAGHSIRRDQHQRYMAALEPFLLQVARSAGSKKPRTSGGVKVI